MNQIAHLILKRMPELAFQSICLIFICGLLEDEVIKSPQVVMGDKPVLQTSVRSADISDFKLAYSAVAEGISPRPARFDNQPHHFWRKPARKEVHSAYPFSASFRVAAPSERPH